ncbi:MAG: hypothetical protein AAFX87_24690 [Bacteroidota bacterium]
MDFQRLSEIAKGNEEFKQEMFSEMIKLFSFMKEEMVDALENHDMVRFNLLSHKVKTSIELLSLVDFKHIIEEGKLRIHNDRIDSSYISRVEKCCQKVVDTLTQKLTNSEVDK